jgi:hypothetical protein
LTNEDGLAGNREFGKDLQKLCVGADWYDGSDGISGHFFSAGLCCFAAGKKMFLPATIQLAIVDQSKGKPNLILPRPIK